MKNMTDLQVLTAVELLVSDFITAFTPPVECPEFAVPSRPSPAEKDLFHRSNDEWTFYLIDLMDLAIAIESLTGVTRPYLSLYDMPVTGNVVHDTSVLWVQPALLKGGHYND